MFFGRSTRCGSRNDMEYSTSTPHGMTCVEGCHVEATWHCGGIDVEEIENFGRLKLLIQSLELRMVTVVGNLSMSIINLHGLIGKMK